MGFFNFFSRYVPTAPEKLEPAHQSMVDVMAAVSCADGEVTPDEYNVVLANIQDFVKVKEEVAELIVEKSFAILEQEHGVELLLARLKESTLDENERSGVYMSGYAVALLGQRGEEPSERELLERVAEILSLSKTQTHEIEEQCRQALSYTTEQG
mgnify:CR=1 FL=1